MSASDTAQAPNEGYAEALVETREEAPASSSPLERMNEQPASQLVEELVATPAPATPSREPSMRTARVTSIEGARCTITWRGHDRPIPAAIAPDVDHEVVEDALRHGEAVLVEHVPGETPLVVGVLQTRRRTEVFVKGATVHVDAERELLLRAGKAAIRLREDGEVELVGSRVSMASRGLLKLVGRILRLN